MNDTEHNPDGLPEMDLFRFLRVGESFQPGDQFWHRPLKKWMRSLNYLNADAVVTETEFTYRRPIRPAAPEPNAEQIIASKDAEIARLRAELDRHNEGEKWVASMLARIMATAASGFADALIVAHQKFTAEHALKAVETLRDHAKKLEAELAIAKADSAMLDAVERLRIAITPCFGTPTPMGSGLPTPFEGFVTDPNDPHPKPLRAAIAAAMKGAQQ